MGNSELKTDPNTQSLSLQDFRKQKIIGRGGFGKVWLALHKPSNRPIALKEMSKHRIVQKKSVHSVHNERILLSQLRHPFLVNMQFAFQDNKSLYLAMDLMSGGDLRFHLAEFKRFSEQQTKFIVACTMMGLEYLHVNGIIHRDVKPENLVFDRKGYLRITDFGIAQRIREGNENEASGTPGYMSPEVMLRKAHGIETDYFALGVLAYECMLGKRPYVGRSRKEIRDQILVKQIQLKKSDVPSAWSLESADFINKLLRRNPKERLGVFGPQDVKNHSWLSNIEWKKLLEKKIESPCKFEGENKIDPRVNEEWDEEKEGLDLEYLQGFFLGFYFDGGKFRGDENTVVKNCR